MKRIFLIYFMISFCSPASAAGWVSIQPDHMNLLYSEGDKAKVVVRLLAAPTNPDYQIQIDAEIVGSEAPVAIDLYGGVGVYTSGLLVEGEAVIRITTRIVGDNYEKIVQTDNLPILIQGTGAEE